MSCACCFTLSGDNARSCHAYYPTTATPSRLVTSNCGGGVEQLSDGKQKEIFAELEQYGVRHDDPFLRNITYRNSDGRFCVIDFEFATILEPDEISEGGLEALSRPIRVRARPETPHPPILSWSGATDRGRFRPNNEDAFLSIAFDAHDLYYLGAEGEVPSEGMDFVFAVSDGIGGERSGSSPVDSPWTISLACFRDDLALLREERHDGDCPNACSICSKAFTVSSRRSAIATRKVAT
ncbi:MAG: hypothetical protein R3B96_16235 [Pirellulaceae bacterium]